MTIYVSLEPSPCICMETVNLRKKPQKHLHSSQKKLEELVQDFFQVFV